jgi:UDP-N-acetylmuramate--alanine ligase
MRALADVLGGSGWTISGSDLSQTADDGPNVLRGHDARHVPPDADLVVASSAIPPENCELVEARRRGIPVVSYAEMLGRLTKSTHAVAVAGTHGKSTIAAMLAEILLAAGRDPTIVIGASPVAASAFRRAYPHGGRTGTDSVSIVEACEYRRNFLNLSPRVAVIGNIEPDHFDCYASDDELHSAFTSFAARVAGAGELWIHGDCAASVQAASSASSPRHPIPATTRATSSSSLQPPAPGPSPRRFGFGPNNDLRAVGLTSHTGCYQFEIQDQSRRIATIRLAVPGRHNVANALAAFAVAYGSLDVTPSAIRRGLEGFRGLSRRLEELPPLAGVRLVDDYAHHPTEVASSLAALREMAPAGRIWCVFQPHQVSRTERLLDQFAASLKMADKVLVTQVFHARESRSVDERLKWGRSLALRAQEWGCDAEFQPDPSEVVRRLAEAVNRGELTVNDLVVTMGAGDVGKIVHDLRQRI